MNAGGTVAGAKGPLKTVTAKSTFQNWERHSKVSNPGLPGEEHYDLHTDTRVKYSMTSQVEPLTMVL